MIIYNLKLKIKLNNIMQSFCTQNYHSYITHYDKSYNIVIKTYKKKKNPNIFCSKIFYETVMSKKY